MTTFSLPAAQATALRRWMLVSIAAVFLAVSVGGITRLTESGLSITEWRPVSGVLPPMNEADWQAALEMFQQIPQAQTTHAGITMGEFKFIYWWEWFHRIVARTVGLVFAVPFLWFWMRRQLPRPLFWRLSWLPVLTLAQGFLGWYMVQSGLAQRTEVSAVRLAMHLSLALAILVVALWTYADLRERPAIAEPSRGWKRAALGLAALIGITIVTGAFVAGLRGGRVYNTWPLMGNTFFPDGYAAFAGFLYNAVENPIAAQFHHRMLAYVTTLAALAFGILAERRLTGDARRATRLVSAAVLLQVKVGIVTLLLAVPVWLGALHQFVGVVALSAAVLAVHRLLRPGAGPAGA